MALSALQFSEVENNLFPFGVSAKAAADTLRNLGDKVESGELCIESVRVIGLAAVNRYAKTSIRMVLIEKHEATAPSQGALAGTMPPDRLTEH